MRTSVADIQEKVPSIKKSIQSIKLTSESLGHKEEDLDDSINDTFDQLVAMLEQRRTCLLNQLHFRVASKRDKLDSQLKDLEDNLSEIVSSCEFVDKAIDSATSTQLLLVRKQAGESLKAIQDFTDSVIPTDTDYVELSLSGLEEAKTAINQIGSVVSSSCIPSLCL